MSVLCVAQGNRRFFDEQASKYEGDSQLGYAERHNNRSKRSQSVPRQRQGVRNTGFQLSFMNKRVSRHSKEAIQKKVDLEERRDLTFKPTFVAKQRPMSRQYLQTRFFSLSSTFRLLLHKPMLLEVKSLHLCRSMLCKTTCFLLGILIKWILFRDLWNCLM